MHAASGFLLLEAVPGRERDVLDRLARVREVSQRHLLFGSSIAVRLECAPAKVQPTVARLKRLAGVAGARLYPVRNA